MILKNKLTYLKSIFLSKQIKPQITRCLCTSTDSSKDTRQTHFGFENVTEREKEEKG